MTQLKLSDYRNWDLVMDMNHDGAFTVSDAVLWLKSLFFMPGDWILCNMGETLTRFFEVTPAALGGYVSAAISAVIWMIALGIIGKLME